LPALYTEFKVAFQIRFVGDGTVENAFQGAADYSGYSSVIRRFCAPALKRSALSSFPENQKTSPTFSDRLPALVSICCGVIWRPLVEPQGIGARMHHEAMGRYAFSAAFGIRSGCADVSDQQISGKRKRPSGQTDRGQVAKYRSSAGGQGTGQATRLDAQASISFRTGN